jgi:hypothetical protein
MAIVTTEAIKKQFLKYILDELVIGDFDGADVLFGCGGLSQEATLFPKSDPKPLHPSVVMSFGHENKEPPVIWGEHPLGVYTQSHSQPFIEADKHS